MNLLNDLIGKMYDDSTRQWNWMKNLQAGSTETKSAIISDILKTIKLNPAFCPPYFELIEADQRNLALVDEVITEHLNSMRGYNTIWLVEKVDNFLFGPYEEYYKGVAPPITEALFKRGYTEQNFPVFFLSLKKRYDDWKK